MRYAGPFQSAIVADRQSRAAMIALCRERGVPYPLPPGPRTGGSPLHDPAVAYATHATVVRAGNGGLFWSGLTPEIELLPPSTESVDGQQVALDRAGPEKPNSDFLPDPPGLGLMSAQAQNGGARP